MDASPPSCGQPSRSRYIYGGSPLGIACGKGTKGTAALVSLLMLPCGHSLPLSSNHTALLGLILSTAHAKKETHLSRISGTLPDPVTTVHSLSSRHRSKDPTCPPTSRPSRSTEDVCWECRARVLAGRFLCDPCYTKAAGKRAGTDHQLEYLV